MVGDSNVARRNGIQYHEDGVDCACYECEIKRLRVQLAEARELLADAGNMIDHTSDAMLARRDHNRVAAQPHEAAINDWLARIKIVLRT